MKNNNSRLLESDLTDEDIKYIRSMNLKTVGRPKIATVFHPNMRKKIKLRHRKFEWDAFRISLDLDLVYWEVKSYIDYIDGYNDSETKRRCNTCETYKLFKEFCKKWNGLTRKCRDCQNERRREIRLNDPVRRARLLEQQRVDHHKKKHLKKRYVRIWDLTWQAKIDRIAYNKRKWKLELSRKTKKIIDNKRLLNKDY